MSNKILEPTKNQGSIIGILQEKRLTLKKDLQGVVTSIQGSMVIRVDEMDLEVPYFCNKLKKDGTENPMFDGAYTIYQEYVSAAQCVNTEREPDKIECSIDLNVNDFISKKGQLISGSRIRCNRMSRVKDEDFQPEAKINMIGFIKSIDRELDEEGQETGRLKVVLYHIAYGGKLSPIEYFVPEEIADSFENYYQVNDTVEFVVRIVKRHIGKVEVKREAVFGNVEESDAKTTSGYDTVEYHLIKGYAPIEDPEEQLSLEDIELAEKERKIYLENLKQEDKANRTSSGAPISANNPFRNSDNNNSPVGNGKPLF